MKIDYIIKNSQDVYKVINRALRFYNVRDAALFSILLDKGFSTTQIAKELKIYGIFVTERAISLAVKKYSKYFAACKSGVFSAKNGEERNHAVQNHEETP